MEPSEPPPAIHADAGPFYSSEKTPSSPVPPDDSWRGVMVSAPRKVEISKKQPLVVIAGFHRFQGADYPKDDQIKVTAVDLATGREVSGHAGQQEEHPDVPPPPGEEPDPAIVKRMVFSHYFNFDLLKTLKLPKANATYKVKIEVGDHLANELVIQVVVTE